jgi:hypothetical protein
MYVWLLSQHQKSCRRANVQEQFIKRSIIILLLSTCGVGLAGCLNSTLLSSDSERLDQPPEELAFAANETAEIDEIEVATPEAKLRSCTPQRIIIPAYTRDIWNDPRSLSMPVSIIILYISGSGPGSAPDPFYVQVVSQAKATGVKVLGYVYTRFADRDILEVLADIDKYHDWYGINDIFVDNVPKKADGLSYIRLITDYIRGHGGFIVLNPGVILDEAYMGLGDVVVIRETYYDVFLKLTLPEWTKKYSPEKFSVIIHTSPRKTIAMKKAISKARKLRIGWVYFTDRVYPSSFTQLPSYWSSELKTVKKRWCPR